MFLSGVVVMNINDFVLEKNNIAYGADDGEDFVYESKPVYCAVKRFFGILLSLIAIIVLSPLFAVVAILISVWDGKGKPIFVQERCGKNGKIFKLYKFRTMCIDAEEKKDTLRELNEMDGPVFKIKDDPRITKIGKFLRATNIDELPQLFNILKGDMSIVGPRPPLPDEVKQYDSTDKLRLLVTPGLTCYWQASPDRNDMSFKEWMELDRKYIKERSLAVDIKLIFKTAYSVICHHDGR